ncbi:B12-binding domain-containing protein, partial [Streptomyces sp. YIM 98790]|uniref:B12-binding domain-containing protein n=1 Tax=Streptomyces sp. YIM 98790 TaxID=2689077 RepID=UPI001A9EBB9A
GPRPRPAEPDWLPVGRARPECRGLGRAALRLDSPAVDRLVGTVLAAEGPVTTWNEVLAPALRAVGRKWASSGERYVEVEHLLSWHASSLLRRLIVPSPGLRSVRPPVLLACMPEEQHCLALEALAAALAARRVPLRMLGAAVPPEALLDAVHRTGPAAVVLWSQVRQTADPVLAHHLLQAGWETRGARVRPVVLAAGPGWGGRRPR